LIKNGILTDAEKNKNNIKKRTAVCSYPYYVVGEYQYSAELVFVSSA